MEDKVKGIIAVENKYGLMMFRMGLTYLIDIGVSNLADDVVEENIRQILAKGEEDKANGTTSHISPEFQCNIIRCAAELSKFSIWTLFSYIKKHLVVPK